MYWSVVASERVSGPPVLSEMVEWLLLWIPSGANDDRVQPLSQNYR